MKIRASNAGTISDFKANVEIGKVHGGYFSSKKNIDSFIKIGIMPIEKELPEKIGIKHINDKNIINYTYPIFIIRK